MTETVSEYLARIGRKGAESANSKRTPAQRKKIAKKAIAARWAKSKDKKAKP